MLKERNYPLKDSGVVLHKDTDDKGYKRHKYVRYRNLVVKSLLAFLFGLLVCFLLKLA